MGRNSFQQRSGRGRDNYKSKHRGAKGGFNPKRFRDNPNFEDKNKQFPQRQNNQNEFAISDLKEEQVFVTEYVSTGEGFRGILKSR